MSIFGTKINVGIGDLIYMHSILETGKHKYDEIHVNLRYELIDAFRGGGSDVKAFTSSLSKLIYNDPKYKLDVGGDYLIRRETDLLDCGFECRKPNLTQLCNPNPTEYDNSYIVVLCKIRDFPKNIYDQIIGTVIHKLQSFSGKIVIMGEREIEMNPEYQKYGRNRIYSAYSDWINGFSSDKIVDLTVPKLGITSPNLEKLMLDCAIMRDCRGVVIIGLGGGVCLATAVSNRIVGMSQEHIADYHFWNRTYQHPTNDVIITTNRECFFANIDKLVS